jgi:hypothetical protein
MTRIFSAALTLTLAGALAPPLPAADIRGTAFNLPPNLTPITNTVVIVNVFPTITLANGQLQLDAQGEPVNGPNPITARTNQATGEFTVTNIPGAPRVVNIEFNRSGQGVTRRLKGVVLRDNQPYLIDVIVPEEMAPCPTIDPTVVCPAEACPPRHFSRIHRR